MGSSEAMGEQTTRELALSCLASTSSGAGATESKGKFLFPLAVPSSASALSDTAGLRGKGFPRIVELRFFFRVRKMQRWKRITERLDSG